MRIILKHYKKCISRFKALIKEDLEPKKIAAAISWGFFLGIIPFFFALNILLSLFVSWRFKLNHLLVQLVNNIIYPLQLLLFVPFLRLGVSWFSGKEVTFSTELILAAFRESLLGGLQLLGYWNLYGLLAWIVLVGPISLVGYFVLLRICLCSFKNKEEASKLCDEVGLDLPFVAEAQSMISVPQQELVESY